MKVQQNHSLKDYNTFGIDVKADYFATVKNAGIISELSRSGILREQRYVLLGGGSNVLFDGDFRGLIIHNGIKGIKIIESTDLHAIVEVGAGEVWHSFVKTCLKNKFYGLENLALIPGYAGAAPVQNIGAYGVEQDQFFESLNGYDIGSREFRTYTKEECDFGYRDSVFKRALRDRFIITSVKYRLYKDPMTNTSYKELQEELEKFGVSDPDPQYIFDTVCRIRGRKLPDPAEIGNGGSFFKNPVISSSKFDIFKKKYPDLTGYQVGGGIKVPAAWLIEKCGWKGKREGDAGVYPGHALILVNYGKASGGDILDLAEEIMESVNENFGIRLETEVRIIR